MSVRYIAQNVGDAFRYSVGRSLVTLVVSLVISPTPDPSTAQHCFPANRSECSQQKLLR
jgi:hypothetical protein